MRRFKIAKENVYEDIHIELDYKLNTQKEICVSLEVAGVLHGLLLDLEISHEVYAESSGALFNIKVPKMECNHGELVLYVCTGAEYFAKELKDSNSK